MGLAAVEYTELNIGVENVTPVKRVVQSTDFNIGLEPVDVRDDWEYTEFNVGLQPAPHIGGEYADFNIYTSPGQYHRGVYLDFNIDPNEPPKPHIWYVRPQWGREGLMFNVIGMGFGTTQDEFGGVVRLGPLASPVMQWELQEALTSKALRIGGYASSDADFGPGLDYFPFFTPRRVAQGNLTNTVVLAAGDVIEFDYINRTPTAPIDGDEIHPIPFFAKLNAGATTSASWSTAPTLTTLVDTEGRGWTDLIDTPVGEVVHREFIVPGALSGQRTGQWGVALFGESTLGRPPRIAEFARFVIRDSTGVVKMWVTLDDDTSPAFGWGTGTSWPPAPSSGGTGYAVEGPVNWVVTSFVNSPTLPPFIDYGATNVEHEWIIVLVPEGAESGMVKVVLEDL